jgi:hypothetical protein
MGLARPDDRMMKIRIPHPVWFLSAALVLCVMAVGLRIGVPAYYQRSAINELRPYGNVDNMRRAGPEWIGKLVGDSGMNPFDDVESFRFRACWEKGQVTDDAVLANLRKLPKLRRLDLAFTRVTDAGMEHLCDLQQLEELNLVGTKVTDRSVPQLKRLRTLMTVLLWGSQVTNAGVAELQRVLPELKIER